MFEIRVYLITVVLTLTFHFLFAEKLRHELSKYCFEYIWENILVVIYAIFTGGIVTSILNIATGVQYMGVIVTFGLTEIIHSFYRRRYLKPIVIPDLFVVLALSVQSFLWMWWQPGCFNSVYPDLLQAKLIMLIACLMIGIVISVDNNKQPIPGTFMFAPMLTVFVGQIFWVSTDFGFLVLYLANLIYLGSVIPRWFVVSKIKKDLVATMLLRESTPRETYVGFISYSNNFALNVVVEASLLVVLSATFLFVM